MRLSKHLRAEREFVERSLATLVICADCHATLKTLADACTADLDLPCPGYLAIERVKNQWRILSSCQPDPTVGIRRKVATQP
jgi:hypothetical protein